MRPRCQCWAVGLLVVVGLGRADEPAVRLLQTSDGVRFGVVGEKKAKPAPTLFNFATTPEATLKPPAYGKIGALLAKDGWLHVALDVPCHGADRKDGEPAELNGWRKRLEQGDDLTGTFARKASAVLDHLIKEGYADPQRIAVCGTSRGGFMALHWAAAEPRVGAVVAFAPVTDLPTLREFHGLEKHAGTNGQALIGRASKLAGRPIWVCIGNNDERVGTDHLIAFTRKVVAESLAQKKPAAVELRVTATLGHRIHDTAHEEAALWIAGLWSKERGK